LRLLKYNATLKTYDRRLRGEMTDAEQKLWSRLRRKQIGNVQFYRQKPLGVYIVDFYAPALRLVVEVDGSQHQLEKGLWKDGARDDWLVAQGLTVLRFDNLQVLREIDAVVEVIAQRVMVWLKG
jgi:very-short-patch-repair endonuclease